MSDLPVYASDDHSTRQRRSFWRSVQQSASPSIGTRSATSRCNLSRRFRSRGKTRPSVRANAHMNPTRAAADLLAALGADLQADGVRETPRRMAAAYAELLTPRPFKLTTFPNDEGYDELVLVREIPFQSLCMHHMLPFQGVAHVAYLPAERILGLSKLARVVELFSRDLQLQERLTTQIA